MSSVKPREIPTITAKVQGELVNNARRRTMSMPKYLDQFKKIPDVMDVNLRINIRSRMAQISPKVRGRYGDSVIGATAVRTGSPVITSDRVFSRVLREFGVEARKI